VRSLSGGFSLGLRGQEIYAGKQLIRTLPYRPGRGNDMADQGEVTRLTGIAAIKYFSQISRAAYMSLISNSTVAD
jgi:hypothetical protein